MLKQMEQFMKRIKIRYIIFVLIFAGVYLALSLYFFNNVDTTPASYDDYKVLEAEVAKFSSVESDYVKSISFENEECKIIAQYDQGNIVDVHKEDNSHSKTLLIFAIFVIGSIIAAFCCIIVYVIIDAIAGT